MLTRLREQLVSPMEPVALVESRCATVISPILRLGTVLARYSPILESITKTQEANWKPLFQNGMFSKDRIPGFSARGSKVQAA